MSGVEILNQYNDLREFGVLVFILGVIVFSVSIGCVVTGIEEVERPVTIKGVIGIVIAITLFFITYNISVPHYQVTISEDVNFSEFADKYEIIEQEEKIYTVVERDDK